MTETLDNDGSIPQTEPAPGQPRQPGDQHVRDLVSRDGLGQTLFVEAGAGTGKTTQLVDRIVNLVLRERVSLSQIAAITFTEAAAAELKSRIRVRFETVAHEAKGEEDRRRCERALEEADLAAISTLHGFAARLLTEFSLAAELPPRVRVLDEVASQLAAEDRWERFIDSIYDDGNNEALLIRSAALGVALEPRYANEPSMKDVAHVFGQNWDRLDAIVKRPIEPVGVPYFVEFDRAVDELAEVVTTCTAPDDKLLLGIVNEQLPLVTLLRDITDPERKLRLIVSSQLKAQRFGQARNWDDVKHARGVSAAVVSAANDVIQAGIDEVLASLGSMVARFVLKAAQTRREEGGLEFHDLLVLARTMLRHNEEARATLHDRYRYLFLDEFQDTDPIQIELATLVAASIANLDEAGEWDELEIDDGRLFFVGDPKQSIYRFRRADIGLFLAARDRFGHDGRHLNLTTNFRTVNPVIEFVNSFFTTAMAEEMPGKQPKYEPLEAWRSADSGADHRPVLVGGPHPDPKVKADVLRELEATDVAATIASMVADPDAWPVLDEHTGEWRAPTLSDVTILIPTRTSLPFLSDALRDLNIAFRLATGTLVYATQEVVDTLAALRAIDDPTDEIALVAALRSPLFACSDVDLATFRQAGGRWDVRRDAPESVAADHPVREALAYLRVQWEQRWWTSPSTLIDRLLRDRNAAILAFADDRPGDVWRRLRFLVDQARAFEESGGSSLRGFVEWAALQGADGARVHEPLLPETDEDAVRILTIHGSKGLEFAITVLSGMTTQVGRRRGGVSVVWEDEVPEVKLRSGVATARFDARADLEAEMDEDEKLRLLYVATTRARDHLVIAAHHSLGVKKTPVTYASMVHRHFFPPEENEAPTVDGVVDDVVGGVVDEGDAGAEADSSPDTSPPATSPAELVRPFEVPDAEPVPPSGPGPGTLAFPERASDRDEWIRQRDALLDSARQPRVVSATSVARMAAPDAPIEDAEQDDDVADQNDDAIVPQRRRGRTGSAIGTAVHATLELIDLAEPPASLDSVLVRQCEIEGIPDSVNIVAALVRSALASESVSLAAAHPHHCELFVSAPVGSRVIEGYVDLLIEGPDGLIVVDYKTDSANSPAEIDAKLASYELQGASYAVALEAATGERVADVRFVFCKASGAIERSVTDLPAAMERVRVQLEA